MAEGSANGSEGKGGTATDERDGISAARVKAIMREAKRAAAIRVVAEAQPTDAPAFDAQECVKLGVNPDGTIAAGGLTDEGREFADEAMREVSAMMSGMHAQASRTRDTGMFADISNIIDALGLEGPVRTAVRAGAQALAAALNDGAADGGISGSAGEDPGVKDPRVEDLGVEDLGGDGYVVRVDGPFVILRPRRVPNTGLGAITVDAGGIRRAGEADEGELTIERVIELAAQGVATGVGSPGQDGLAAALIDGAGKLAESRAAFIEMLKAALGSDVTLIDGCDEGAEEAGEPADSGPSTEAPSMPSWPEPQPAPEPNFGERPPSGAPLTEDGGKVPPGHSTPAAPGE